MTFFLGGGRGELLRSVFPGQSTPKDLNRQLKYWKKTQNTFIYKGRGNPRAPPHPPFGVFLHCDVVLKVFFYPSKPFMGCSNFTFWSSVFDFFLGWDSPNSTITVFSFSRVFHWKLESEFEQKCQFYCSPNFFVQTYVKKSTPEFIFIFKVV